MKTDAEWAALQEAMRSARTPEEKRAAAAALASYIPDQHRDKNLVTMQKGGLNVIKLGDLPAAMEQPGIFERVKKIITGR